MIGWGSMKRRFGWKVTFMYLSFTKINVNEIIELRSSLSICITKDVSQNLGEAPPGMASRASGSRIIGGILLGEISQL